ncbi:MAG TPA: hypothetical protein VM452_18220 [Caulifigura sp.]|jgi:hypothetical protein|nr:hypothetical protein [Caulifigura sp.]
MEPTEQVPGTPPPKRRRRRWLIVAFALVLVSMVSWWNWPRGDARFVGKWGAFPDGSAEQMGVFEFRSSGFGNATLPDGRMSFPWFVRERRITFGHESAGWVSPSLKRAAEAVLAATGQTFAYDADIYEIVAIDRGEIQLTQVAAGHKLTLRRIPE